MNLLSWLAPLALLAFVQAPQRDAARAPIGTASLTGVVMSDEATSVPLRRVSVTLLAGGMVFPQVTMTDESGAFAFTDLPAGNYTLLATKPGHVQAFYGSKTPGRGPGVPIAVLEGQRVTGLRIRMLRGGVITGVVRHRNGQPAPGVGVIVAEVQLAAAGRRMSLAIQPARTDDRGVYRAFGLAPGSYVVLMEPREQFMAIGDLRQVSPSEVSWAQSAAAAAAGGAIAPTGPAPDAGQTVTYAPVYYPGTPNVTDAASVTIGPAEERSGVDLVTVLVPTAKVTGVVLDPEGRPLDGVQVTLRSAVPEAADLVGALLGESGARTSAEGKFALSNVRPGRYAVTARGVPRAARTEGGRGGLAEIGDARIAALGGLLGMASPPMMWATDEITVAGRDIGDLTLRLQPGMTVSGKIVYEGSAKPPTDHGRTPVMIIPAPTGTALPQLIATMADMTTATVAADGTFAARGVTPGKYRMTVMMAGMIAGLMLPGMASASGGWSLKSVTWNGRDIADVPFDVKASEDIAGVVIALTDQPTELSGTVLDQAGRVTPNFPMVVFSTDRTYWTIGSRRVQQARPASDGKYKIAGLPAGEYYLCAVTDVQLTDLYDPTYLEQLVTGSIKLTLKDGEKKVQDLKLQ